jgi:hypothetical protein
VTEVVGEARMKWGTASEEQITARLQTMSGGERMPALRDGTVQISETVGWEPACRCRQKTVPCTVLDPFVGSGTVMLVAAKNGRNSVGIDLQKDYVPLILKRLEGMEGDLVHPTQVIVHRTEEAPSCETSSTSTALPAD